MQLKPQSSQVSLMKLMVLLSEMLWKEFKYENIFFALANCNCLKQTGVPRTHCLISRLSFKVEDAFFRAVLSTAS